MPNSYKPDLNALSPEQHEVAVRLIRGSNQLYREFAAAITRDPNDVVREQQTLKRVRREYGELQNGTRARYFSLSKKWPYPSFGARGNFLSVMKKNVDMALDYQSARQKWDDLVKAPDYVTNLCGHPIDLQQSQEPKFAFIGCVDSRVDPTTLLCASIGEVLPHRKVALAIENPDNAGKISVDTAGYLAMAVEAMHTPNIVLMPHGKCGGIKKADHYTNVTRPDEFGEGLMWDMLQAKSEVFQDVRTKGPEFYLSRLDLHDRNDSEHDRFLQAVEIADSVRVTRQVTALVRKLKGGANVTISTAYMDLRTLNPHLLINAESDDWKLLRLTGHPKLPCTHEGGVKVGATNDNVMTITECGCRPSGSDKMFSRLLGKGR